MTRSHVVLIISLAGLVSLVSEAEASNKLFVGGLSWSTDDSFSFVDTTTGPGTVVQDVSISLRDSRAGTLLSPGTTLLASSSTGVVNPGLDDLGDAGFFDVFYAGTPGDFPTSSFFDVLLEITGPGTGPPAAMNKGTIKFFNESKGFGFIVNAGIPGAPDYLHSLTGEINPAQPGLTFSEVLTRRGEPGELNFEGIDVVPELQFDGAGSINPALPLFRITMTNVPEPSACILASVGLAALMAVARNRRRRTASDFTTSD